MDTVDIEIVDTDIADTDVVDRGHRRYTVCIYYNPKTLPLLTRRHFKSPSYSAKLLQLPKVTEKRNFNLTFT
jgi:hypothetical protein